MLNKKIRVFFSFFRQPSTKFQEILKIPHLPEQIFKKLVNESLFKCREVARSWQNIIDGQNYSWLRVVNIPTVLREGNTYLHLAAATGQIEPLKTALNKDEEKNTKNGFGETMFHLACMNGHLNIVKFLIKSTDLEINVIDFQISTLY